MVLNEEDVTWVRHLRQYEMAEELGRFGHWYWTVGSEQIDWSPAVRKLLGLDDNQLAQPIETIHGFLDEVGRERLQALVHQAIVNGKRFALDFDYNHPEGSSRKFHCVGEAEVNSTGRTVGIIGMMQDVTEDRQMARALEEANKRQHDFVDLSSDWVWEMDADLRFTYTSHQMEETLGIPAENLLGKTRREMLREGELSLEMEMNLAWMDQHKPFQDFRFWTTSADGERKCISSTGKPIFDKPAFFSIFFQIYRLYLGFQRTKFLQVLWLFYLLHYPFTNFIC